MDNRTKPFLSREDFCSIGRSLCIDHPQAIMTDRFLGFEPARRVAVFSEQSKEISHLCGMLKRLKFSPLVLEDMNLRSTGWRRTFERFAELCIVDISSVDRFLDPVEFCQELRRDHDHIPLIMLSETCPTPNLLAGPERLCDASTPYPRDRSTLIEVISSAQSNCLCRRLSKAMA